MPYLGAPFVEEGDFQGLLDAIDIVVQKNPKYLLHGHEPLTRNFASASMLTQLKIDLIWLREQVLTATRRGDERGAIHEANLVLRVCLTTSPMRICHTLFCANTSLTVLRSERRLLAADLQGLEHLTRADHAELLVDYLGRVGKTAGQGSGTLNRKRQV